MHLHFIFYVPKLLQLERLRKAPIKKEIFTYVVMLEHAPKMIFVYVRVSTHVITLLCERPHNALLSMHVNIHLN